MWVELDHPQRGKWWNVGMPIKLSASPAVIERSPTLGEHTDEVLKEVLGYDEAKIAQLKSAGAFSRAAEESGLMKIAIIGQQDFGKAVLEAFLARSDEVAGVFCAPEKPGAQARRAAGRGAGEGAQGATSSSRCKSAEAHAGAEGRSNADIGIMAFVLQFAPQDFVNIPKHGTIQYHPSLLPKYRGPSSINWPIIRGDTRDRPHHLPAHRRPRRRRRWSCRRRRRSARTTRSARCTSTACSRWACRRCSRRPTWWSPASTRRSCRTSRRPPTRAGAARPRRSIHWANHVDFVYNLIRGCDPAPGAWTTLERQEAAALRRAQAPGAHLRRGQGQDRRGRRGRRDEPSQDHRAGRPHRSAAREARRRQESRRRRAARRRPDQARRDPRR